MTEEIVGERMIQMDWVCRYCKARNPGLSGEDEGMRCAGCGHPKDVEQYLMPGDTYAAPTVTDPRLLAYAEAGENIRCLSCNSDVRAHHPTCPVCGADPRLPPASYSRHSSPSFVPEPPPPASQSIDPSNSPSASPSPSWLSLRTLWLTIGALLLVAASAAGVYWLVTPREQTVIATITAVSWARASHLERRRIVVTQGWGAPPIGAENVACWRLQHGTMSCHPHDCNCQRLTRECNCTGGDDYKCDPYPVEYECNCTGGDDYKCNPQKVDYECSCSGGDDYDCNPHKVKYDCNCTGGDDYKCDCHDVEKCTPLKNGAARCVTRRVCDTCTHPRRCDTCSRTEYDTCTHPRKCATCSKIEYDTCTHPRVCATCTKTEYLTCTHPRVCQQCPYTECDTCYDTCPNFDDLCAYDFPTWDSVQTETRTGNNSTPEWPVLFATGRDERVVHDTEKYVVSLVVGDQPYAFELSSADDFERYKVGEKARVHMDPSLHAPALLGLAD